MYVFSCAFARTHACARAHSISSSYIAVCKIEHIRSYFVIIKFVGISFPYIINIINKIQDNSQ